MNPHIKNVVSVKWNTIIAPTGHSLIPPQLSSPELPLFSPGENSSINKVITDLHGQFI